jgi:hypothetical protein
MSVIAAEPAVPLSTFSTLPIKEITVFKDGHAFVAHEGDLPTDDQGNVVMDFLPAPVLGTFWAYSADHQAKLTSVLSSRKRVLVDRTALSLRELLEANIGADALVTESGANAYEATIIGLPTRSGAEQDATNPANTGERLPEKGSLILLKTAEGTKAVPIDRIQEVTFKQTHKAMVTNEEFRNLMTLKLDWGRSKPAKSAKVGLFYLQKGMRWIPEYKIEIDGQGNAKVKLQATLVNELADLADASVNLVVGVPAFAFKDTIDPMALQQNLAQLSPYFQADAGARNGPLAAQFSNAIMAQQQLRVADYNPVGMPGEGGLLGPGLGETSKTEDLFVFNVPHVTLKRGERMVLPIAEFTLPYKDIFALELSFAPPAELRGNLSSDQQREMARLLNAPKAMHKLRLTNTSKYPLTTAPALMIREGRVLAQGLMTYTPTGASVDLSVTTAVDFQCQKSESETKRTPNAMVENGNSYSRIDLGGKISLTSHRPQPAEIEVTRYVLGSADQADHDAQIENVNLFENADWLGAGDYPYWWGWYGWPSWWHYINGVSRITWKITLQPDQTLSLSYDWHYFWR